MTLEPGAALLTGKVAVVTGGGGGIGRGISEAFAAYGARVVVAEIDEERAAATEAEIRDRGGDAVACVADVREPSDVSRVRATTLDAFGRVDVLVNNAGTARWRDIDDVPDADWQAAWDINVMACLRAMRTVAPGMRERGWGRIVNVSSTAAKRPSRHMPEYSVAKAALLSLSRLYAHRLAPDGVLVNAVCPGPTKSELWVGEGGLADQSAKLSGLAGRDEAIEKAGAGRPIGRLAEVGEIAAAIVFLCSEEASYVAGAAWSVDGGTVQVII